MNVQLSTPQLPTSRPVLASHARLRWDRREQVYFLLYPERGLRLNDTAASIVQLCDGDHTIAEIAVEMGRRHPESSATQIAEEVRDFLSRLAARGLLTERAFLK